MSHLEQYLRTLSNQELVSSIRETSGALVKSIEERFDFHSQLNGLLLGHVQSGKTGQMLGAITRMADLGYSLFLLLTTDNIDLHKQTYDRVKGSLSTFSVVSERDEVLFGQVGLTKPMVIVLKKNARVLRKWQNILLNTSFCKGLALTIFDDEADAASLNTLVNRNRVSTINQCLSAIKETAVASIYIEVTATPQAVILQSHLSGWKPSFVTYFNPGRGYLGGSFFYSTPESFCARFIDENEFAEIVDEYIDGGPCPQGLHDSIMTFLVVCGYKKIRGEQNCNFMIHPSVRIRHHNAFAQRVQEELTLLQIAQDEQVFDSDLKDAWSDLQRTKPDLPYYDDIKEVVKEILNNTEIFVIPLNSKSFVCRDENDPNALQLNKGFNIVVGGNTLSRGLTFPHLQVVYYCRSSKTTQADTYWQHSRIFGYDREAELVRLYIPKPIYKLFAEMNMANEILVKQVVNGIDNLQLIYPNGIVPTRKNVLDNKFLYIVAGGTNYFASEPIEANLHTIDGLIAEYAECSDVVVDKDTVVRLLSLARSRERNDFDTQKYIACCNALSMKRPSIRYRLIARTNRDIAKGTGTLLSPNDRSLGDKYNDDVVLTMYRVNGSVEKGWSGTPVWVPNIKFPSNACFYDTFDVSGDES